MSTEFEPLSYDLIKNSADANSILGLMIGGKVGIAELFQCEPGMFANVRDEALAVVTENVTAGLDAGHPTFDYVRKWDPSWRPKPNTIFQYSLFNSRNDLFFFEEDHHWFEGRRFNSRLKYIPEFFRNYFKQTELQNFRIQAVSGGADLGQHRERIIAIPNREHDYKLRFHLPVVTSKHVKFMMDGAEYKMVEGSVYLFNQSCMHGVANEGSDIRIHLVWDCYLNDYIVQNFIQPSIERP